MSSSERSSRCVRAVEPGHDAGVFRMAIDRSFTVAGHGTVVTGTVASGSVAVGDELEWLPGRQAGAGARACIVTTGRSSGSAAARARRSTWSASITPRSAAATSWPRRAISNRPGSSRSRSSDRHEPSARCGTAGRYKLHLGTAEVPGVLSLLEPDESGPGVPRLAQLLAGRAGRRGPRPAVRPPRGEPAGDAGRRPGPPARRRAGIAAAIGRSIDRLGRLRSAEPLDRLRAALTFLGPHALDRASPVAP